MKNGLFKMVSATTLAGLMFVGCGGGSSSGSSSSTPTAPTTLTGTFIDAQVKGLHYKTATQEGDTNENGEFKYLVGETIEFKLGNLSLGSVNADGLITPYTLAGDTDISNPSDKAVNIALLLQNFDADRTDGILDVLKLKDIDLSTFSLSDTPATNEGKISAKLPDANLVTNFSLIDVQTAKTNLKNGVSQYSLKYNKKFTQAYLDQVVFYSIDDTDGDDNPVSPFILKMKFIDGIMYGDDSGTPGGGSGFENWGTYTIDANGLINGVSSNGDGNSQIKITAVYDDYIEGSITNKGQTKNGVWYTNKAKADAKLAQLQYENLATTKKFTQAYLDQVTLYQVQDGIIKTHQYRNGVWLFDDTGSALVPPIKHEGTYTIDANGELAIIDTDGNFNVTISTVTADYIETTTSGAITQTVKLYTDKSKAQAELTGSTISFVSGKTIVMNDQNSAGYMTLVFDANGNYEERGFEAQKDSNNQDVPYTCYGKWKDLGNNKIAGTCDEGANYIRPEVTGDVMGDNGEIHLTFSDKTLSVSSNVTVDFKNDNGVKEQSNITIKSVSAISDSSTITVASGFTAEYLNGKTLWTVDNSGDEKIMTTFAVNTNNTITYGSPWNLTVPYVIMADGIIDTTEDNGNTGHEYYKIVSVDGTKISLCEGENLNNVKNCTTAEQWLFTNQADAQAFVNSL